MRLRKPAISAHGIAECPVLEFGRKLLCRLPNYLEIAHHYVDRLFGSEKCERIKRPANIRGIRERS